jgi:GH24 family phage-related lysozyme (muramidase)
MNVERIQKQLEADEGVKYVIYIDHLGYPTFGIGHRITREDKEYWEPLGTSIPEKRVREAFEQDLCIAIGDCEALYGDRFSSWPRDVHEILVNMMFNMGRTRMKKFKKMREALLLQDWKEAAKEGRDSKWHKQVPNRAERLMVRLENVS